MASWLRECSRVGLWGLASGVPCLAPTKQQGKSVSTAAQYTLRHKKTKGYLAGVHTEHCGRIVLFFQSDCIKALSCLWLEFSPRSSVASLLSLLLSQSVPYTAATVMLCRPRSDHITALLRASQRHHTSLSKLKATVLMITSKT